MNIIKDITEWEIETPSGWSVFTGIKKLKKNNYCKIVLDSGILEGSLNHKIKIKSGKFKYLKNIIKGDILFGGQEVLSKQLISSKIFLYDLLNVEKKNEYYTNGIISHNCAFIDNVETIFTAAQQTLATGGKCIAISTPNGTGNWFYEEFTKAEIGKNKFTAIRLPWTVHPERDQAWRDEQDQILGPRDAAQECDASFLTSGTTVIEPDIINYYETLVETPVERRGLGGGWWIWRYPDFSRTYAVIADTGRGDGSDYSAFQIMDIESCEMVAEFQDQIDTRTFGNMLVTVATEWNDALLIIENTGIGWDVVQTAIQRGYQNIYYSPRSSEANASVDLYLKKYGKEEGMVPGFTNSTFTRPLVISKLVTSLHTKSCKIYSKRLIDELRSFVWKNGKAQANLRKNDDLVMTLGIGLFLRDTALVFRTYGADLTKAALNSVNKTAETPIFYNPNSPLETNPWTMKNIYGESEDLRWLLK